MYQIYIVQAEGRRERRLFIKNWKHRDDYNKAVTIRNSTEDEEVGGGDLSWNLEKLRVHKLRRVELLSLSDFLLEKSTF